MLIWYCKKTFSDVQFIFPPIQRPIYLPRRVQRSPEKQGQHWHMKYKCPLSSQLLGQSLQITPIFIAGGPPEHSSVQKGLRLYYYIVYSGRTQGPSCKHQL